MPLSDQRWPIDSVLSLLHTDKRFGKEKKNMEEKCGEGMELEKNISKRQRCVLCSTVNVTCSAVRQRDTRIGQSN
uniref:Uncharacterized protein n=1 Tax=Setaria digitata TaxID=48799 RepID=A0A915PIV0_9BILA